MKSSAFTHVFMPWIGINTWCRFDDIDSQPAHIFGAFIYEYAMTLSIRKKDYLEKENGWCVLDGRIIHQLEKKLKENNNYTQIKNFNAIDIIRENKKIKIKSDNGQLLEFDKVIVATQPFQALPLIEKIGTNKLINELRKLDHLMVMIVSGLAATFFYNAPLKSYILISPLIGLFSAYLIIKFKK